MTSLDIARSVLDEARWAPSGDNTQPWRFEILDHDHVMVHACDTREDCIYDLDGHSSHLAIGALLESVRIAASGHGLRADIERRPDLPETQPTFDVRLRRAAPGAPSELLSCLRERRVHRRALSTRKLEEGEKQRLQASLGADYCVYWMDGLRNRWRMARLLWRNAGLRLTLPEAYAVHRKIIEWDASISEERIPAQALGANPLTLRLMRFALESWPRVQFMNRWLGGTLAPRIELDLVPALACGAHFLVASRLRCRSIDDYLAAGAALQRFWLTATLLGLQLQPQMTPLIFARYAAEERRFSALAEAAPAACEIAQRLERLFGAGPAAQAVFMGRIGAGAPARARSLRLPLERLLVPGPK